MDLELGRRPRDPQIGLAAAPLGERMRVQLERIAAHPGLSNSVLELAAKAIG